MKSLNVVAVVIGAIVIFVISGVVVIAVAVPEGAVAGSLIALLIALLAPTITSLVGLAKIAQVAEQQQRNVDRDNAAAKTIHELANGKGDAKFEAAALKAVRRVMDELDPNHPATRPTEETPS